MGLAELAAQLAKAGNRVLDHNLKPAVEKLRDMRLKDLKRWLKWREKSDEKQRKRRDRASKL